MKRIAILATGFFVGLVVIVVMSHGKPDDYFPAEYLESEYSVSCLDDVFLEVMCQANEVPYDMPFTVGCGKCGAIHIARWQGSGIYVNLCFDGSGIYCNPCGYPLGVDWKVWAISPSL